MSGGPEEKEVVPTLVADHRRLDDLFGRFLASGDRSSAERAIRDFDEELRRHMTFEEDEIYPPAPGGKLVPQRDESEADRLFRELRLEHVQIRELSGMIVRHLAPGGDPGAARALAGSLARRWDAHTAREEQEGYSAALAGRRASSSEARSEE